MVIITTNIDFKKEHQKQSIKVKKLKKRLKNKAKTDINKFKLIKNIELEIKALINAPLDPYDNSYIDVERYKKEGRILALEQLIYDIKNMK